MKRFSIAICVLAVALMATACSADDAETARCGPDSTDHCAADEDAGGGDDAEAAGDTGSGDDAGGTNGVGDADDDDVGGEDAGDTENGEDVDDGPEPVVDSLNVYASETLMEQGGTVQLVVEAFDEDGLIIADAVVEMMVAEEAVATVDEDFLVTAVGPGSTSIYAYSGEAKSFVQISVTDDDEEYLTLDLMSWTTVPELMLELTPTIRTSPQNIIDDSPEVTYSSDDSSIASVDEEGVISSLAVGETVIRVEGANGHKAATFVIVGPLP